MTVPRLHVITDETLQNRYSHAELATLAFQGGADAVQYREKRLQNTRQMIKCVKTMVGLSESYQGLLVVNDRVDIASMFESAAVHLGKNDLPIQHARSLLGTQTIIGGTANSLQEVEALDQDLVDYLGVGPVYGTQSKAEPAPTLGLEELQTICQSSSNPVIAIGNIQPSNVEEVIAAGAWGIAVLSGVVCQVDVRGATQAYHRALVAAVESA